MRTPLLFSTIIFSFFIVFGQTYTGVPDDNFEQYLIDQGYDSVLDDYVLTSNINEIVFLDISSQNISDLRGIEDFSSLAYLTCSNNLLTEIALCNNLNLLFLDCSNNPVSRIDLSPSLQTLICEDSGIEELDLSTSYSLQMLNIVNSPIECVQVGGLYESASFLPGVDVTWDPNGEDYFASDCNYFSWECSGPLFNGWVYYDENENNIKDESEIYLANQIIVKNSTTDFVTATSSNSVDLGRFSFYLTDGQYEVSVMPNDAWMTTSPEPVSVNVEDFIPSITDIELGVRPIISGHNDMAVDLTAMNQICGIGGMFYIHYENLGVINNDIEIELFLDQGVLDVQGTSYPTQTYSSASVEPTSFTPTNVVWNIDDVGPGEEGVISVLYNVPPGNSSGVITSSTTTTASVVLTSPSLGATGVMDDNNLENNYDQVSDLILCAWDPNDKLVSPSYGDENYVEFSDTLEYTLRFQNVGNYFAFNIRIEDTISDFLDMTTFKFIESSHDVYYEFGEDRSLAFYFDDIMLPDSISDPLGSQGFVKFSIAPKDDIDEFTVVENTGFIYFDYNEAVVTNTTMSTFVSEITFGCWDSGACNFNSSSLIEDNSSCEYAVDFYDCQGNCLNDFDLDSICDELDNCPTHYNPEQLDDDADGLGNECDSNSVGLDDFVEKNKIKNQINMVGQNTLQVLNNGQFLIYIYEDGSVKKHFTIKY